MHTLSIRELRNRPGAAQEELTREGELLLTSNGRPVAVMLAVDGASLDETLEVLRRARGQLALSKLRRQAAGQQLERLTDDEIEREIAETRAERPR